ncbi:RES family NAD+ phosphorylase [Sediminibacterium goheungense]|uniref:RES domain-containing protein n=1 Tax=Sediminibacterium goheungense TaxID=1086393 RepID=A0A4R6ISE9_9BACT|nr:RES family NAD+ phosphorylase [Sediminibacterium goheungense]TDO25404.1 RES domain-containing protein [Sediminibacterium goheungense]
MILYRFAHHKFAHDLSGTGAKLKGGRWNLTGTAVVYTSSSISLALLETLANTGSFQELQLYKLMQLNLPTDAAIYHIQNKNLKKNWPQDFGYTQWMGSEIMQDKNALAIACPSGIVQHEVNFLLNPLHSDFHKIRLQEVKDFYFDERLFPSVYR